MNRVIPGDGGNMLTEAGVILVLRIELDRNEILGAAVLLDFLAPDLNESMGYVTLKSDGRVRTWASSDSFSAVSMIGEPDQSEYRILLCPAQ